MSDGPTLFDPKTQGQSANWGESSVSVHPSLLGSCGCVNSSTLLPGAHLMGGPGESTTFVGITASHQRAVINVDFNLPALPLGRGRVLDLQRHTPSRPLSARWPEHLAQRSLWARGR